MPFHWPPTYNTSHSRSNNDNNPLTAPTNRWRVYPIHWYCSRATTKNESKMQVLNIKWKWGYVNANSSGFVKLIWLSHCLLDIQVEFACIFFFAGLRSFVSSFISHCIISILHCFNWLSWPFEDDSFPITKYHGCDHRQWVWLIYFWIHRHFYFYSRRAPMTFMRSITMPNKFLSLLRFQGSFRWIRWGYRISDIFLDRFRVHGPIFGTNATIHFAKWILSETACRHRWLYNCSAWHHRISRRSRLIVVIPHVVDTN